MTSVVSSKTRHQEVAAVLKRVEAEGVIELDASREAQFATQLTEHRFAIVDSDDNVVGYISGSFRGGNLEGREVTDETVVAFIALIAIEKVARRHRHGSEAIRLFAHQARADAGATVVGLNLDEKGDIEQRRASFERIGFAFAGLAGVAAISDLLGPTDL